MFLDSGTCLGFWDMFWILGSIFGFWDVFWILGSVLSLRATVETRKFAVRDETRNKLNFNTTCCVTSWKKFFVSFKVWPFWLLSIVIKHRIVENNL